MESHPCQVVLLDGSLLELTIQPKMLSTNLFDLVASHLGLKEKEYFGLYYLDDCANQQWLQSDRKVMEHEVCRKSSPGDVILLYLSVRFYIEDICYLVDPVSVELFFLQARRSVYEGVIEADSSTIFKLAALNVQIFYPNLTDDGETQDALKQMPLFPASTLGEHPSMAYCQKEVLQRYYAMTGTPRGQAITGYMSIVEKLPTYGIHYYEVKDKQGVLFWLGLSFKGIAEFEHRDKRTPRRVFPWKYLENLYFRDKKFSIEVHDPKRVVHTLSSFNLYQDALREPSDECDDISNRRSDPSTKVSVSKRTQGPSNVNVYAWFTTRPQLTKAIWSMAVCQHQFFLDRHQNKDHAMVKHCPDRMAEDITYNPNTLLTRQQPILAKRKESLEPVPEGSDTLSRRKPKRTPEEKAKQKGLYKGLASRRDDLQKVLDGKIAALKQLCLKESEITGELPHEYSQFMKPGEKTPEVQRRVGTAFSIADLVHGTHDALTKVEMEYELQKQILKAKQRLSNDESLPKSVRKRHKIDYVEAHAKLKELEEKLKSMRLRSGYDTNSFNSDDFSMGDSWNISNSSIQANGTLSRPREESANSQPNSRPYKPRYLPPSNQSSTSSLASVQSNNGREKPATICNDFTPIRATRPEITRRPPAYRKPVNSMPSTSSADSGIASIASSSSIHAYNTSARPIKSGSMDDMRVGMASQPSTTSFDQSKISSGRPPHPAPPARSESKGYLANNPYGSLERKAHKQKRSNTRLESQAQQESSPPPPPYHHQHNRATTPQADPRPVSRPASANSGEIVITRNNMPPQEYAQNVQQASRRMFPSEPPAPQQPFEMVSRTLPRNHHSSSVERVIPRRYPTLTKSNGTLMEAPAAIHIPRQHHLSGNDSTGSGPSSPKENAFQFFTQLANSSTKAYPQRAEMSKPLEYADCVEYNERLKRARGQSIRGQSSASPAVNVPPTPAPRRLPAKNSAPNITNNNRSRPIVGNHDIQTGYSGSSLSSMDGSRSGSPYTGHQARTDEPSYHQHLTPPRLSAGGIHPGDSSFNTGDVGDNFSQEMLDWYNYQDDQTKSTLV